MDCLQIGIAEAISVDTINCRVFSEIVCFIYIWAIITSRWSQGKTEFNVLFFFFCLLLLLRIFAIQAIIVLVRTATLNQSCFSTTDMDIQWPSTNRWMTVIQLILWPYPNIARARDSDQIYYELVDDFWHLAFRSDHWRNDMRGNSQHIWFISPIIIHKIFRSLSLTLSVFLLMCLCPLNEHGKNFKAYFILNHLTL